LGSETRAYFSVANAAYIIIAPQARRAVVAGFSVKKRVKSGENHYCAGCKSASASAKNAEAFGAKSEVLVAKSIVGALCGLRPSAHAVFLKV
jgi:hypothetical protein